MARMGGCIAGNYGAQGWVSDPIEEAGAQDAGPEPALAGDHQNAARLKRGLTQHEIDQLAVSRILRVAVQVEARVDFVLAAADTTLARKVFRWAGS